VGQRAGRDARARARVARRRADRGSTFTHVSGTIDFGSGALATVLLRRRRRHRASAERALHVLEAIEVLLASADAGGARVELRTGALAAAA
jgi:hypothetical protein